MDITALTQKVAADEQAVTDAQTALQTAQETLAADQATLAQATLINGIEALTADDVNAVNNALASDNSNFRVQDITPVITEPAS